jgi:hypothetical protein
MEGRLFTGPGFIESGKEFYDGEFTALKSFASSGPRRARFTRRPEARTGRDVRRWLEKIAAYRDHSGRPT